MNNTKAMEWTEVIDVIVILVCLFVALFCGPAANAQRRSESDSIDRQEQHLTYNDKRLDVDDARVASLQTQENDIHYEVGTDEMEIRTAVVIIGFLQSVGLLKNFKRKNGG